MLLRFYIPPSLMYYKILTDFVCIRYGDKCPKSLAARFFSIIWILLGLIIMAMFTANITSALTAVSLQLEPSSLVGVKVGLILSQLAVFAKLYPSLCVQKHSLRASCAAPGVCSEYRMLINFNNFGQNDTIPTFTRVFLC